MKLHNITKKSEYVKIKRDIGRANLSSIGEFWIPNIMQIRNIYVISDEFWKNISEFCAIRWHTRIGSIHSYFNYCDVYVQHSDYMKYNKHFEYLLTLKNSKLYKLLGSNEIFESDEIIEPCLTPNNKWRQK